MGYSDYDLARPMIGVANSWNRLVPGHYNLHLVSEYVKQGIFQGGARRWSSASSPPATVSPRGTRACTTFSDPRADRQQHRDDGAGPPLDAVVLLGSCDKIVPGMLMAAARLDFRPS